MSEQLITIDEIRLERLNLEIYDYLEHIKVIFNQMDEVIDQTKECFDSESGEYYRNMFLESHAKNKIIIENLLNITQDITKVRNVYTNFDTKIKTDINTEIEHLDIPEEYDFHVTIHNSEK